MMKPDQLIAENRYEEAIEVLTFVSKRCLSKMNKCQLMTLCYYCVLIIMRLVLEGNEIGKLLAELQLQRLNILHLWMKST